MKRMPGPTARLARHVALLLSLGISAGPMAAQPKLEITSPKDGEIVFSGKPLIVKVVASPPLAFRAVGLWTGNGLPHAADLTRPPYEFTIRMPPDIASRSYTLSAAGVTFGVGGAFSETISIVVERPDSPLQLEAQPSTLGFDYVGDDGRLRLYGKFSDGSKVDLTYSSKTTYSSDTPAVASVDDQGTVKAVGPGTARITIRNAGKAVVVPATVPPPVSIWPGSLSLHPSQTRQFDARVAIPTGKPVTWSVTWSLNPALGTIDKTGLYTAPSSIDKVRRVTVTATSVDDTTKSASVQVTLLP